MLIEQMEFWAYMGITEVWAHIGLPDRAIVFSEYEHYTVGEKEMQYFYTIHCSEKHLFLAFFPKI